MLKKLKKRLETGVLVTALVVPLALCVFAFLGLACYFAFRDILPPELAALVTAACGIVLIALILVIARIANAGRGSSPRHRGESPEFREDFEDFLRAMDQIMKPGIDFFGFSPAGRQAIPRA